MISLGCYLCAYGQSIGLVSWLGRRWFHQSSIDT